MNFCRFLSSLLSLFISHVNLPAVKPLTSYTCKLTDAQAAALQGVAGGAELQIPRSAVCAVRGGEGQDQRGVLRKRQAGVAREGHAGIHRVCAGAGNFERGEAGLRNRVESRNCSLPRLGVDESGKGDFFGPLCIAGVYVNGTVIEAWKDAGIRDSKNIGSDKKIKELAELIKETPGCVHHVVPIGNEAYNRLYLENAECEHAAGLGTCAGD